MKVLSVAGTRPQFVKEAALSPVLRKRHQEVLVNTGQHYDYELCREQFDVLELPEPDYDLETGSDTHARQTASMLVGLEEVLQEERPDLVVVYGDTNSTLAGALAAAKLRLRLAHVEAGPRQHDMSIPEEINRVITDRLAPIRFAPTAHAAENLKNEGITEGVYLTGDVMYDIFLKGTAKLVGMDKRVEEYGVSRGEYVLMTLHRPHNSDDREALSAVLAGVLYSGETVLFPVHPRTVANVERFDMMRDLRSSPNLKMIKPVHYLDMLLLSRNARAIVTDSGGVTKEAYFCGVPAVCIDRVASWPETVEAGWCTVTGADSARITEALRVFRPSGPRPNLFGEGDACEKIVEIISGPISF